MKNYKEFTTIKKEYKNNILTSQRDFKKDILSKDEKSLKDLYIFNQLTKKQQSKTLKEIKTILIEKRIKEDTKQIEKFFKRCDEIANAESVQEITIRVEWVKNRTWGYNPRAEVCANGYTTGSASGCGYDKLSSAVAEAFNKNNSILKLVFNKIEEAKRKGFGVREFVGYGVDVFGFSYGVGYSSFRNIFNTLGAKVNEWHETKSSDFMLIRF